MGTHRAPLLAVGGAALLAAALVVVCHRSQPAGDRAGGPGEPSAEEGAQARPELSLPAEGHWFVAVRSPEDVTILANRAKRTPILRELERQMGFRLSLRAREPEGEVSVRVQNAAFERAVAQVLRGYLYAIVYDIDVQTGEQTIARLKVGHEDPDAVYEVDERGERVARAEEIDPSKVRFASSPEEDPLKFEEEQEAYVEQFADEDPAVRAEAAGWSYPDEEAVPALGNLLTSDPDPGVRAAAADGLSGALDNPDAIDLLLEALDDPEPEVVLASLDALEFLGDQTLIPDLSRLLDHPDVRVRTRAVEVIGWLQD